MLSVWLTLPDDELEGILELHRYFEVEFRSVC